jgi:hypothetical protein
VKIFNKRLVGLIAGLVIALQSSIASAGLIDYELEFSAVDAVSVGQSFDVDVFVDITPGTELATFGFNFENAFTHLSFDGFSTPAWIGPDALNDVGGLADIFGLTGDNIQIATLHFTAISDGIEKVSTFGNWENIGGAYFYDYVNDTYIDGSIGGSFNVKVPEPSIFAVFLLGMCGVAASRKSRKA